MGEGHTGGPLGWVRHGLGAMYSAAGALLHQVRCYSLSTRFSVHLSVTMAKQGSYANDQAHGPGKRMYAGGDTFEVRQSCCCSGSDMGTTKCVLLCV